MGKSHCLKNDNITYCIIKYSENNMSYDFVLSNYYTKIFHVEVYFQKLKFLVKVVYRVGICLLPYSSLMFLAI